MVSGKKPKETMEKISTSGKKTNNCSKIRTINKRQKERHGETRAINNDKRKAIITENIQQYQQKDLNSSSRKRKKNYER